MRRRLLNLLTALSLLLCIAVAALCVSCAEGPYVIRHGGGGIQGGSYWATYALVVRKGYVGIGWTHSDVWFEGELGVPVWLVLLGTGALPVWWAISRSAGRAKPSVGACRACGYDLTGNVSGVCPECGTPRVKSHKGNSG